MIIENTTEMPVVKTGRPNIYPFEKLLPGQKLIIDPAEFGEKITLLTKKVSTALYHYKRNNKLNWMTAIRTKKGLIFVYRVN